MTWLIMEGLSHDFYTTNYIKNISEWRNIISEGEYNKSIIEYPLKLQYFNKGHQYNHKPSQETLGINDNFNQQSPPLLLMTTP